MQLILINTYNYSYNSISQSEIVSVNIIEFFTTAFKLHHHISFSNNKKIELELLA